MIPSRGLVVVRLGLSIDITAWDHADLCHTIPYEILCNIASRVPRTVAD